ncbi:MAG: glycosyltransferase [Planctomycetota bacterium]
MAPLTAGPDVREGWVPIDAVGDAAERLTFEPLPAAWRVGEFVRAYPGVRRRIRRLIAGSNYLLFSLGGLVGDWGAVAAREARRMGRPYAVWTDRVESEVTRAQASSGPLKRRLCARLTWRPMRRVERHVIRHSTVGLFHGADTHRAYASLAPASELVHNIHVPRSARIDDDALDAKADAALDGPLRIVYAGRMADMKGPLDWLDVLEGLAARGVDFAATWMGDGEWMPRMRERVARPPLAGRVELPGFVGDRDTTMDALQQAHLFLFCHKTPESPRCLIESLIVGTPIVGYASGYARDLTAKQGGGRFVQTGEVAALTDAVAELAKNRPRLAALIRAAAADGRPFNDEDVFAHRSEVLRARLPRFEPAET